MKTPYDKVRAFMARNTGRWISALQVSAGAEILDLKPTREALEQLVREGFISAGQVDGTVCYLHGAPIAPSPSPPEDNPMSKTDQIRAVLRKANAPVTASTIAGLARIDDAKTVGSILSMLAANGEAVKHGSRPFGWTLNPDFQPSAQQQKRSRRSAKAAEPKPKPKPARRQNITIEPAGTISAAPAIPAAPKVNGHRRDGLLAEERALQDAIDARVDQIADTDPILRALIAEQKRLQQLIEDTRL